MSTATLAVKKNNGLSSLSNIHHAAYRCRDAEQTRWFYEDLLGLKLATVLQEEKDFGDGKKRAFVHLFFELGDGNYIAFFDEPSVSMPDDFKRKDSFDAHIAFETDSMKSLLKWHEHINSSGKICLGPVNHEFVHSIYMYDPNGWQVEITCKDSDYTDIMNKKADKAHAQLKTWTEQTRAMKIEKFGQEILDKRGRKPS